MNSVREFLSIILSVIFAVGMPALVSWLKNCDWPRWKKGVLSLLVAAALGAVTVLVNGEIDPKNFALFVTGIFTAATTIYNAWFKETRANGLLETKKVLP